MNGLTGDDNIALIIHQEVEEFLRDLTLEYPFPIIFETLRRHGYRERFGAKITPLPDKKLPPESMRELNSRVQDFLGDLRRNFGSKYESQIQESFRFYTQTTLEN